MPVVRREAVPGGLVDILNDFIKRNLTQNKRFENFYFENLNVFSIGIGLLYVLDWNLIGNIFIQVSLPWQI
jgi:hypothetical protein